MVAVSSKVITRDNTQISSCGTQELMMVAAMLASIGMINTQNHQYIQPILKPAHLPMARSA
ncbi:hypothetical protein D3C85_997150 [compost metagenome]